MTCIKVHAGKKLLASAGQGLVIVWSLEDYSKVATFEAHEDVRTTVAARARGIFLCLCVLICI